MTSLDDLATFRSGRFAPVLPEEAQVNPGVYGAELAYWLCTELARQGVVTSYPEHEDWGWYVEHVTASGAELAVHCGNESGTEDRWLLSLRRHGRGLFGRNPPPLAEAVPLAEAIRSLLETEASITELDWCFEGE